MKSFPYNRDGAEGRRLFRLLQAQHSPGKIDARPSDRSFRTEEVPAVLQCRVDGFSLIIPANLSGLKRPQMVVQSTVEHAWGSFADGVTELDCSKNDGLPLSYTMPIQDETLKMMIDAGLYRDEHFELLMSKLLDREEFDAEASVNVTHLAIADHELGDVPVILVDPVHVVHNDHDPSEHTTLDNLVRRTTKLAIELRKDGIDSQMLAEATAQAERDREVYVGDMFKHDATIEKSATELVRDMGRQSLTTTSELLDKEIDVTDVLRDSIGVDATDEDIRIRQLKDKGHREALDGLDEVAAGDAPDAGFDESEFLDATPAPSKPKPKAAPRFVREDDEPELG